MKTPEMSTVLVKNGGCVSALETRGWAMLWRRVHDLYCGGGGGGGCSSTSPHALDTPHHTPNHHVSQRVCWCVQDGIVAKYSEGRVSHTFLRCRVQKYFAPLSPIATPGVRTDKLHPTNMFYGACTGMCWAVLWAEVQKYYRNRTCGCAASPCPPPSSVHFHTGREKGQNFIPTLPFSLLPSR